MSAIEINNNVKKEIDTLFFGDLPPDRREILNDIVTAGINLKNIY